MSLQHTTQGPNQEDVVRTLATFALVASFAALCAAPAGAGVGSHQVGLDLGASVPSGDFSDAASTGFNVGGVYQYNINRFGVGGEVKYHSWNASTDMKAAVEAVSGAGSEMKFTAMEYDVFGIVNLPISTMPMVTPYVKGGMGWYAPEAKLTTPSGDSSTSNSDFGMMAGLGLEFDTHSPVKFGLGGDYHRVKNSDTDFMSFSARILYAIH